MSGDVMGAEELVLELPPDPAHVRTARLFAAAAARQLGVDEERVDDLKIAISEACTNAIKAHVEAGVGASVRVFAFGEDGVARFDVVDAGPGFDPERAPGGEAETYTPPSGVFEGSLGLAVIRSLFPAARIARNVVGGMTVSIAVERSPLLPG